MNSNICSQVDENSFLKMFIGTCIYNLLLGGGNRQFDTLIENLTAESNRVKIDSSILEWMCHLLRRTCTYCRKYNRGFASCL